MKLQTKPQRWLCAATAFAIALDIPLSEILARVGHDGSDVIFPHLAEPLNRRGHHVQELIGVALTLGHTITPIELWPVTGSHPDASFVYPIVLPGGKTANWLRVSNHIANSRGTIEGMAANSYHMVAYDHGRIFDPDGGEYDYSREHCEKIGFLTRCLWRMDKLA